MSYELMTIAATIQAAEIQAAATYKSAIYGAVGICIGLFITWATALHIQKVNRLAETRRGVYLDLVESYSNMITGLHTLVLNFNENWPNQLNLIMDFSQHIDKTVFVCETKTKIEIFKFITYYKDGYLKLEDEMSPFKVVSNELAELLRKKNRLWENFNSAAKALETTAAENPTAEVIQNYITYTETQLAEIKNMDPLIEEKKEQVRLASIKAQKFINNATDELNKNVLNISHLLRKELGAKTNILLDESLYKK